MRFKRPVLTVKELREALSVFPDDYSIQLVTDVKVFSRTDLNMFVGPGLPPHVVNDGCMGASVPLVRVSTRDTNSDDHKRVWLYAEGDLTGAKESARS